MVTFRDRELGGLSFLCSLFPIPYSLTHSSFCTLSGLPLQEKDR